MPDTTPDPELLRRYAEEKSEAAFAELVHRHLNFVYAAAMRRLDGDTQLAEAVTQQVFAAVAREAAALSVRPMLVGWLYTRMRNAAANTPRPDRKRSARETPPNGGEATGVEWEQLRPVLDETMDQLSELDREAVLRRLYREDPLAELAETLAMSENAARIRVERVIARIHAGLRQRGIHTTPAAVERALARNAAVTAPAALYTQVTNSALDAAVTPRVTAPPARSDGATRMILAAAAVLVLVALCVAAYEEVRMRGARATTAMLQRQTEELREQVQELQVQMQSTAKRAQAADEDNARLIDAMNRLAAIKIDAGPADEAALTQDDVDARFSHAQELARAGRLEDALKEFLWCYTEGMVRFPALAGVRNSFLVSAIAELGRRYPPAQQALRQLRDAAEQRMRASQQDRETALDVAALNDALGEPRRTLAEFDRLPPDDARRQALGSRLIDALVTQRRYREAAQARSYAMMNSFFDMASTLRLDETTAQKSGGAPAAARMRAEQHDAVVKSTARDVEVLAGAGDLDHARSLAGRLLQFDDSDETRRLLQQRAERAGQPDLLATMAKQ